MELKELRKNWEAFGKTDPLYAILSWPDKEGGKWATEDFFANGREEVGKIMRFIELFEININRKKALDFGCGVGRLTQALAEHFEEVSGVDIASSMIELAEKYNKFGDRCKYHHNDSDNLGMFLDNHFDFIYSNVTLQHMEPQYARKYLKEFLRVLNSNGLLVFQLPSERIYCPPSIPVIAKKQEEKPVWKPVYEAYAIKREEIIAFIEENNGVLRALKENWGVGPDFVDYLYFFTKK
jgi:ubiquinone/menaquinone biosynthesis C-methylase UbiE